VRWGTRGRRDFGKRKVGLKKRFIISRGGRGKKRGRRTESRKLFVVGKFEGKGVLKSPVGRGGGARDSQARE